jgi:hypothetical protein
MTYTRGCAAAPPKMFRQIVVPRDLDSRRIEKYWVTSGEKKDILGSMDGE